MTCIVKSNVVTHIQCDKLIKLMFTTNDKLSELFDLESAGKSFVLCRKCYDEAMLQFVVPRVSHFRQWHVQNALIFAKYMQGFYSSKTLVNR